MNVTDEQIMAYVDGHLSAAEADAVQAVLAVDQEAASRARLFGRSTMLLQQTYAHLAEEEVPQALIDRIRNFPEPRPTLDSPAKTSFLNHVRDWCACFFPSPAQCAVYALLLCFGLWGGWFAAQDAEKPRMAGFAIPQSLALSQGLEQHISGSSFKLEAEGLEITPVLTFMGDGHYCRQFEIRPQGAQAVQSYGIAYRDGKGIWHTTAVFSAQAHEAEQADDYMPASGQDLGAAILSEMGAVPLSLEEEKKCVREHWHVAN